MTMHRRHFLASTTIAAASMTHPFEFARAQGSIDLAKIVVGFPAGTTPDVLARKVGERLSKGYANAVLVDNKPGAGGQLAVTTVKAGPPDGSNILLTPMSILGIYPSTYNRLPYDPIADLAPVSMGVTYDQGIAVGPSVPETVKTLTDLIAWYKANPSQMNMGSPATGSSLHFLIVMIGRAAGINLTHVGYKGSGPAIMDMLGGTLPAVCSPLGTFLNQPKLRIIATSGAIRSRFTPNVSTLVEQGFKDLVHSEWYGFYLARKAPQASVTALNGALRKALAEKDIVATLATYGMDATPSSPEQLAAALKGDMAKWAPIVKSTGFRADA